MDIQIPELLVQLFAFAFALWLGLYLISRDPADSRLVLAGLGLVAYAIGLALDILQAGENGLGKPNQLANGQRLVLFLPALFWVGLLLRLLPGDLPLGARLRRHPRPWAVIAAATLFFTLGLGLLIFPVTWLPPFWVRIGIGVDLLLLGVSLSKLDASEEGEALLPHFLRSFSYAFLTALLFGGQVGLVIALSTGFSQAMLLLLLTTMSAAILIQTFSDHFENVLDGLALLRYPQVRRERARLQVAATAASRVNRDVEPDALEDEEFIRLTRRALGHLPNLPKLASSPLTRLSLVEQNLAQLGANAGTLERANELKAILSESITRLKPRGDNAFGTGDDWRYYNALYFPYVMGLKPYSRRPSSSQDDRALKVVIDWFRANVPQRTLYNWQNAAAELVARDLRERSRAIDANG